MIDAADSAWTSGPSSRIQINSASRSLFRSGQVRVFVENVAAGGTVILRVGSERIQAKTTLPLRAGEWYVVRPERGGAQLSLRVESHLPRQVVAAEIGRSAGLPENSLGAAVVEAFIRSGLALKAASMQRAYRAVERYVRISGREEREAARLAALLDGKGLPLSEEFVGLLGGAFGQQERESRHGRDQRHEASESGSDKRQRAPSAGEVRSAFSLAEDANSPLQLFNHVVGAGDHWVIVPLAGTDALRASLRLRLPRGAALGNAPHLEFREASLVVERGDERWVFGVTPAGQGMRAVLLSGPGPRRGKGEDWSLLERRLLELGVRWEAGTADESPDGFSTVGAPAIIASVDSSA
jgi:hypothetical protein